MANKMGSNNLLKGDKVASRRLCPVNTKWDEDTYVRDAKQAELHHAYATKSRVTLA